MYIPFGVFSAGAGAGETNSFELISTTLLGATASSITFDVSTLASTYKHLQVRFTARANDAGNTYEAVSMRFNGVSTSSSYSTHDLYGNGSSVFSQATANSGALTGGYVTGSGSTTSAFGVGVVDILDAFSTSKNKTVRSLNGRSSASNSVIFLSSGAFYSTNAITSINLFVTYAANFAVGSRFSLYGIKG